MTVTPSFRSFWITALVFVLLLQGHPDPVLAQQDMEATPSAQATPTPEEGRAAESFLFYPAEGKWGDYFDITLDAGSTKSTVALISNTGEVAIDLLTYPINAFTAMGGGFDVAEYGEPFNEVTNWLDYPEETFRVEVGQGIQRTFSINVPKDTEPGQYITAIAVAHAEASEVEGTSNFTQVTRHIIPVFIRVPGDVTVAFEIDNVILEALSESAVIRVPILNTGDIRIRPTGNVDLLDESGKLVISIPVEIQTIYARDNTIVTLGIPRALAAGTYHIKINLVDPDSGVEVSHLASDIDFSGSGDLAEVVPITLVSASAIPGPDATNVQFATVDTVIRNVGDPVTNAQLSLLASLNGEEVERYPVSQSLSLPSGETPINTRYIPATGWTSGEWTFELLLETVEPNGAAVVVARQQIEGSITIP